MMAVRHKLFGRYIFYPFHLRRCAEDIKMSRKNFSVFFIFFLIDFSAVSQNTGFQFYKDMDLTQQFASVSFDSDGIIKEIRFENDLITCSQYIENGKRNIRVVKNDKFQKNTFVFYETDNLFIIEKKGSPEKIILKKNISNALYVADNCYFLFDKNFFVYKKNNGEINFTKDGFSYTDVETINQSYSALIQIESINKSLVSYGYYSLNDDGKGGVFYKDFNFYSSLNPKSDFPVSIDLINYSILAEYIPREYAAVILGLGNLRVKHTKADIIDYEASSFLKEGDLQYIAENLASRRIALGISQWIRNQRYYNFNLVYYYRT